MARPGLEPGTPRFSGTGNRAKKTRKVLQLGGSAGIYSANSAVRQAERELAHQAEVAYARTVRDWATTALGRVVSPTARTPDLPVSEDTRTHIEKDAASHQPAGMRFVRPSVWGTRGRTN